VLSVGMSNGRRKLIATCERAGRRHEVALLDIDLHSDPPHLTPARRIPPLGRGLSPHHLNSYDPEAPLEPDPTSPECSFPMVRTLSRPRRRASARYRTRHRPPRSVSARSDHASGERLRDRFGHKGVVSSPAADAPAPDEKEERDRVHSSHLPCATRSTAAA
jgi:hypothetical protein